MLQRRLGDPGLCDMAAAQRGSTRRGSNHMDLYTGAAATALMLQPEAPSAPLCTRDCTSTAASVKASSFLMQVHAAHAPATMA